MPVLVISYDAFTLTIIMSIISAGETYQITKTYYKPERHISPTLLIGILHVFLEIFIFMAQFLLGGGRKELFYIQHHR